MHDCASMTNWPISCTAMLWTEQPSTAFNRASLPLLHMHPKGQLVEYFVFNIPSFLLLLLLPPAVRVQSPADILWRRRGVPEMDCHRLSLWLETAGQRHGGHQSPQCRRQDCAAGYGEAAPAFIARLMCNLSLVFPTTIIPCCVDIVII